VVASSPTRRGDDDVNDEAQSRVVRRYLWSAGSLRLLRRWVRDAWPLWLLVGGFAVAIGLAVLSAVAWSDRLRVAGVLLQGGGLVLIIRGFNKLRVEFKHDGFLVEIGKSIRQLGRVFYRKTHHLAADGIVSGSASISGTGRLTSGEPPTLEQRVKTLEDDVKKFRGEQSEAHQEIDERLNSLTHETRRNHDTLRKQLEHTHLSGLTAELVAVVWLLAGMVLATLADQIADQIARWL
jgi:hypothetical protein